MTTTLTETEQAMLKMFGERESDAAICRALNVGRDEAFQMARTIRTKLGLTEGASLRDAARKAGR